MEIIVLIVIIAFLATVLFLALRKLITTITTESKDYYFKKIQDYDKLIDEKNDSIPDLVKEFEEESEKDKKEYYSSVDKKLLKLLTDTEYDSLNTLKAARDINSIFKIDEEKIINNFLIKAKVEENNKFYQTLLDRFSPNVIYKLKTLSLEKQLNEIMKMCTVEEIKLIDEYLETRKFNLKRFILYLQNKSLENPAIVEILVGDKDKTFDNLSPYIKTTYSDDIYKGFIIKYRNKIYDYSLNERDVV